MAAWFAKNETENLQATTQTGSYRDEFMEEEGDEYRDYSSENLYPASNDELVETSQTISQDAKGEGEEEENTSDLKNIEESKKEVDIPSTDGQKDNGFLDVHTINSLKNLKAKHLIQIEKERKIFESKIAEASKAVNAINITIKMLDPSYSFEELIVRESDIATSSGPINHEDNSTKEDIFATGRVKEIIVDVLNDSSFSLNTIEISEKIAVREGMTFDDTQSKKSYQRKIYASLQFLLENNLIKKTGDGNPNFWSKI